MLNEELLDKVLPCMQNYFQGEYCYKTKNCIKNSKCEYLNGMWKFINDQYPDFNIVHCCDIERQDIAQPEALLLNSKNESIALEMKCIPDNLMKTVKETIKQDKRTSHFWNRIIDDCAKQAYEKLFIRIDDFYKKLGIKNEAIDELLQIIFRGITVKLCARTKEKNIQQIFMDKKKERENKAILSDEMCEFSYKIFEDLLRKKAPILYLKIDKEEYSILLCLTHNRTVSFEIYNKENFTLSTITNINENGLHDYLLKFLNSCEKKFCNQIKSGKNILLLDHNFISYRCMDIIDACIKKCEIPKCISEIWVCDKEIEYEYNKDGDEDGEYIADISYRRLYEVSQTTEI